MRTYTSIYVCIYVQEIDSDLRICIPERQLADARLIGVSLLY